MDFFKETALYKEMLLLDFISKNKDISQQDIANHIDAAVSMTHGHIDKLEEQGYLKREYQSKKIVHYNITPKGIMRKQHLQIIYVKELMAMYQKGEETISLFLDSITSNNFKKVLLYGAGDVANIMLDMINSKKIDIKVLGIIDDDKSKIGNKVKDIDVISFEDIYKYEHDGIVITSFTHEKTILEKLMHEEYPKEKIIKYFKNG